MIVAVAAALNSRLRKTLDRNTPAEALELLACIGWEGRCCGAEPDRATGADTGIVAGAVGRSRRVGEARGAGVEIAIRAEIKTDRRARSAGAQSALGRKLAQERVIVPTLRHLADRVASRLRAKSRPGRTVTVRVRFADLRSVTRSVTLDAPIAATLTLAKVAEELVRQSAGASSERENHFAAGDLGVAAREAR